MIGVVGGGEVGGGVVQFGIMMVCLVFGCVVLVDSLFCSFHGCIGVFCFGVDPFSLSCGAWGVVPACFGSLIFRLLWRGVFVLSLCTLEYCPPLRVFLMVFCFV